MTKAWIKHENAIHDLYKVQRKTLEETMKIMKAQHGFDASTRAYRAVFKKWGWTKYNKQKRADHRPQARPPVIASPYEAPLMTPGPSSEGASSTRGLLSARTLIGPASSYTFRTPDVGYPSLRPDGYRNISDPLSPTSFEPAYSNHQVNSQNNLQPARQPFQNPQHLASPPPHHGGIFYWQGYDQQAQQQSFQQQHTPYRPILPALDQNGQHQGLHIDTGHTQISFLHALLTPDSPASSSMSSIQRGQLITQNIYHLRGLGRLNERFFHLNGQRLSSFELFVQSSAPGVSPGSHVSPEDIHEFCRACAVFVQMEADTTRIVSHNFAQTISLASESRNAVLSLQQQQQQDVGPTFPFWARVWVSACQRGLGRNLVSLDEHLDVLSYWLGEHVVHRNLKELLLGPSSPEPYSTPESTTGQQIIQNLWDQ